MESAATGVIPGVDVASPGTPDAEVPVGGNVLVGAAGTLGVSVAGRTVLVGTGVMVAEGNGVLVRVAAGTAAVGLADAAAAGGSPKIGVTPGALAARWTEAGSTCSVVPGPRLIAARITV
jgi:hypothetical protein